MVPAPTVARSRWPVQVFRPFPESDRIVFGRVAARSPAFEPTGASGGRPVLVGCAAGEDPDEVTQRARAELVERMSNVLAGRAAESSATTAATFDQLRRARVPAVDPAVLDTGCGMAEARSACQLWVLGRSLLTDAELLVPAGAVFLHHRPPPGCAATVKAGSTGVAAHVTGYAASDHAILEVLERDLIRRSWYEAVGATVLGPQAQPAVGSAVAELLAQRDLAASFLTLPGPPGTICVVACLHTADGRQQSFGARCVLGGVLGDALIPALYEALIVRWSTTTSVALRAWEILRARAEPPRDEIEHLLWAFHVQDSLVSWPNQFTDAAQHHVPADPHPGAAAVLADHTNEDVLVVDTTTTAARELGLSVVRVVAPGARALPTGATTEPGTRPHPFG